MINRGRVVQLTRKELFRRLMDSCASAILPGSKAEKALTLEAYKHYRRMFENEPEGAACITTVEFDDVPT